MTQVPVSELEVLGQAAVEEQALAGVAGVDEAAGVADAVEALLVEGGRGRVGIAVIAGRDVRAPDAQLELSPSARA